MRISRAQGGPVESAHVSGRQACMRDVSCSRMREPEGDELREISNHSFCFQRRQGKDVNLKPTSSGLGFRDLKLFNQAMLGRQA